VYWGEVGVMRKVQSQSLPLHRVTDIVLGKQMNEMKEHGEASQHPSRLCFSLLTEGRAVHFIAPSKEVRRTWLAGIREVMWRGGKVITLKGVDPCSPLTPSSTVNEDESDGCSCSSEGWVIL
jgi:hypothetical protein